MMTGQGASGRSDAYLRNNSNNSVWNHPAMQLVRSNVSSMWNHPAMQLIRSNASNMRNHPAIQLVRDNVESLWNHPAVRSVRSSVNSIRNHSAGELVRSSVSSVWNHPAVQRVRSNANSVWNHPAVQRVRSSIQPRLQRNREILSANILTILQGIIVRLILLGITYKLRQSSQVKQLIEIHWDPRMDYCVIPQFAELIVFIVIALIRPSSVVSSELWFWACILVFLLAAFPAVCLLEETHSVSATSIFGSWGRVSFPYRDPDDRGEILQGWLKLKGEMCYLNGPNGNCTNEAFVRMFDADERVAANDDQNENKTLRNLPKEKQSPEKSDEKENSNRNNDYHEDKEPLRNHPKEKMVYADNGYGVRHRYVLYKMHKDVNRWHGPQYDGAYGCGIWCLKFRMKHTGGQYDREKFRVKFEYGLVDSATDHAYRREGQYDRENNRREHTGGQYDRENYRREPTGGQYDRENYRREHTGGKYVLFKKDVEDLYDGANDRRQYDNEDFINKTIEKEYKRRLKTLDDWYKKGPPKPKGPSEREKLHGVFKYVLDYWKYFDNWEYSGVDWEDRRRIRPLEIWYDNQTEIDRQMKNEYQKRKKALQDSCNNEISQFAADLSRKWKEASEIYYNEKELENQASDALNTVERIYHRHVDPWERTTISQIDEREMTINTTAREIKERLCEQVENEYRRREQALKSWKSEEREICELATTDWMITIGLMEKIPENKTSEKFQLDSKRRLQAMQDPFSNQTFEDCKYPLVMDWLNKQLMHGRKLKTEKILKSNGESLMVLANDSLSFEFATKIRETTPLIAARIDNEYERRKQKIDKWSWNSKSDWVEKNLRFVIENCLRSKKELEDGHKNEKTNLYHKMEKELDDLFKSPKVIRLIPEPEEEKRVSAPCANDTLSETPTLDEYKRRKQECANWYYQQITDDFWKRRRAESAHEGPDCDHGVEEAVMFDNHTKKIIPPKKGKPICYYDEYGNVTTNRYKELTWKDIFEKKVRKLQYWIKDEKRYETINLGGQIRIAYVYDLDAKNKTSKPETRSPYTKPETRSPYTEGVLYLYKNSTFAYHMEPLPVTIYGCIDGRRNVKLFLGYVCHHIKGPSYLEESGCPPKYARKFVCEKAEGCNRPGCAPVFEPAEKPFPTELRCRLMQLIPFACITMLCFVSPQYGFSGHRFPVLLMKTIAAAVDTFDILDCLSETTSNMSEGIWNPKCVWTAAFVHLFFSAFATATSSALSDVEQPRTPDQDDSTQSNQHCLRNESNTTETCQSNSLQDDESQSTDTTLEDYFFCRVLLDIELWAILLSVIVQDLYLLPLRLHLLLKGNLLNPRLLFMATKNIICIILHFLLASVRLRGYCDEF